MNFILRWIRRLTRFSLAVLLWLNGILLLRIVPSFLTPLAARLDLTVGETSVLLTIAALSVLLSYGLKNIAQDFLYIYLFPFILLYYAARVALFACRAMAGFFWPSEALEEGTTLATHGPGHAAIEVIDVAAPAKKRRVGWKQVFHHVTRPFRQFILLWAVLLLLASQSWLLWTALVIILLRLTKTLVSVLSLAVFSIRGLSQVEDRITKYAETLIAKVLVLNHPENMEATKELREVWIAISGLQVGVALLRNRQRVVQWVIFAAMVVFAGIYLYLAFLFGFAYYGIARIQGISYSWLDAFVTSFFIPFQYADLPHNIWIKVVAGIHCLFVLVIGIGTIFGYIQRKLDSVYKTADTVSNRLRQDEVRIKIEILDQKFKPTPSKAKQQ